MLGPDASSLARLPHGPGALLLTGASVDRGANVARGARDGARLPQFLLIEMMCQTAGLALPEGFTGGLVAALDDVKMDRAPGEGLLETEARLVRRLGSLFRFECSARDSGGVLARGAVVLRAS